MGVSSEYALAPQSSGAVEDGIGCGLDTSTARRWLAFWRGTDVPHMLKPTG